MEEEKVVVTEEKPEPVAQENTKGALVCFILAIVSIAVSWGWIIGGIAGIICGAIALKKLKTLGEITTNPYRVFVKIAKPVAIVGLIFGILSIVTYTIVLVVAIAGAIAAAAAAAAEAGESAIALFLL